MVLLSSNGSSWKAYFAAAVLCGACGGGDGHDAASTGDTPESMEQAQEKPAYLFHTAVFKKESEGGGVDVHVNLIDALDFSKINLTEAKVFPGYAGVAAIGGKVLVGDGRKPFVYQFDITSDLKLKETAKIDFSAYPVDEWNYMNFYFHSFKDASAVYYFYGEAKTGHVVWDPTAAKIVADVKATKIPPAPAGRFMNNYGNRTGNIGFAGPVVQPFGLTDEDWTDYGEKSWLAVYDPQTHAEKSVIEVPCPGLQQVTKDEKGDLYFSTTYNVPTKALYKQAPASCVVKVKADGTLDSAFGRQDLTRWTGGFYGVNFRYIADGKAIANVLHHDRLGADFTKPVDPAVAAKIDEDASLWELEMIDLATGKSAPVTGFKAEHDIGSYLTGFAVDNRFFTVFQIEGSTTTRSAIYEIKTDGTARHAGDVPGELWGVSRVR